MVLRKKKGVAVFRDRDRIRVLEGEMQGGGLAVTRCQASNLPEENQTPEALGRSVRALLDQADIRTDRAWAVLPSARIILRRFQLPKGSPEEVEQMIHFQALKSLPVGEQSVKMGYFLQDGPDGNVDVTSVGVLHTLLEETREIFGAAGLAVEGVTFSSLGSYNAALDLIDPAAPGDTLVVDVGPGATDVAVIHEGALAFSRSAPVGEEALARAVGGQNAVEKIMIGGLSSRDEALSWGQRLGTELTLSMRNYMAETKGRTVSRVVLLGHTGAMGGLAESLGKSLDLPVTVPAEPGLGIRWNVENPAQSMRDFASLAGALRSDLDRSGVSFNAEGAFFTRMGRKKSTRTPYLAGAAGLCLVLALLLVPDHFISEQESRVKALRGEVERLENEDKKRVEAQEKKADELRSWTRERVLWLDLLLEIARQKPPVKGGGDWGVYITNLKLREGDVIHINGLATTESQITLYAKRLQQSALFRSADATSYQKSSRKDSYPWTYEIVARLAEDDQ